MAVQAIRDVFPNQQAVIITEHDLTVQNVAKAALVSTSIIFSVGTIMTLASMSVTVIVGTSSALFLSAFLLCFFTSQSTHQERIYPDARPVFEGVKTYMRETPLGRKTVVLDESCVERFERSQPLFANILEAYFLILQGEERKRDGSFPVQVVFNELYPEIYSEDSLFFQCNLSTADVIFIPRFVNNHTHFTLVAVNVKTAEIFYFDPNGDIDRSAGRFLDRVQRELRSKREIEERYGEGREYTIRYPTRTKNLVPIQGPFGYHCGFYVCAYAQNFLGEFLPHCNFRMRELVKNYLSIHSEK